MPLYLDTARLGQMSPRACRAAVDFARFSSEHGCSLYLSQLLADGHGSWPGPLGRAYPGLDHWQGVTELGERIKRLLGANAGSEVVLAGRSATLMRLASRLLCGPCRRVLVSDLTWPSYARIFEQERRQAACVQVQLPLRRAILRERISPAELVGRIVDVYRRQRCDGLLLPLVDNLGIRLPLVEIVQQLRQVSPPRFVVVDGAQAVGHVPVGLAEGYCDLFLGGCHKWLQAFTPLGIGCFGNPGSRSYIRASLRRWLARGAIDDPLLRFTEDLLHGAGTEYGETVQVGTLFSASGALMDAASGPPVTSGIEAARERVAELAALAGWRPVLPHAGLSSRILLLEPDGQGTGRVTPEELRGLFLRQGVALSAYEAGLVRLSLPKTDLTEEQSRRLERALGSVASGLRGAV